MWSRGEIHIGIEVKASKTWRRTDGRALEDGLAAGGLDRALGVYRGKEALRDGEVLVLPCDDFLRRLHAGEILAN